MSRNQLLITLALIAVASSGCARKYKQWTAEHVTTLPGFKVPECALYAPGADVIYVSNIECKKDEYWTDDSKGYLSIVDKSNKIATERWVNSEPSAVLHGPKGMCLLGEHLYFTDNTRLMRCDLDSKNVEVVASGFKQANDLATDGKSVWVSDTAAGKVFCVSAKGERREIHAPKGINGITFSDGLLFGVSWDLHDIYELDPTGNEDPVPFHLADKFVNLDGIEALDDGTFLVSDFMGNAVYAVSPDRATVTALIHIPSPADIGINRAEGILYVPQFMEDKLSVYRIIKK